MRLFNFQFTPSENPRIKEQQRKRIFAKSKPKAGQTHKLADKLAISKQNHCTKRGRLPVFDSLLCATCATGCASMPKNYHKGKSPVVVPPELILDTTPLPNRTQKSSPSGQAFHIERFDEFKKKAYDFESVRAAENGTSVKKLRLRDIQKQSRCFS
ncbi:hypothetical protein C1646_775859 [Rhizophagus diaphanus]|nr:hypothetical protein C1646_775859 [Rhizophagus diaphanus] [Rhizophagus sp. MUCL 43196]